MFHASTTYVSEQELDIFWTTSAMNSVLYL